MATGTQKSVGQPIQSPVNARGVTPMMSSFVPFHRERAAQNAGCAAEPTRPICVADDCHGVRAERAVVVVGEHAAASGGDAKHREEVSGDDADVLL
jgi:hypothetical protein